MDKTEIESPMIQQDVQQKVYDRTPFLKIFHKQYGLAGQAKLYIFIPFLFFTFCNFKFDEAGMTLALVNIQEDLQISESVAQWLQSIYFISCASSTIPLSRYSEKIGYVNLQLLLLGMLVIIRLGEFFISYYIQNSDIVFILLLILRFLNGVACGGLVSSRNSMVAKWLDKKYEKQSFHIVLIVDNIGGIIGPIVSGYIIDYCGYQFKFLFDGIISFVAFLSCFPLWENTLDNKQKSKFDILGSILLILVIGLFCLGITFITIQQYIGFGISLAISIVSGVLFVFAEMKHQNPILPLAIMKNPLSDLFIQNVLSLYIQASCLWIIPQLTSSSTGGTISTIRAALAIICAFGLPVIKKKILNVHILIISYTMLGLFSAIQIPFVENLDVFVPLYLVGSIFSSALIMLVYPMINTIIPTDIVSLVSGLPVCSRTLGNSIGSCISAAVVNLLPNDYYLAIQIDQILIVLCCVAGLLDSIFRIGVSKDEIGKLGFKSKNIRELKLEDIYDQIHIKNPQETNNNQDEIKQEEFQIASKIEEQSGILQ